MSPTDAPARVCSALCALLIAIAAGGCELGSRPDGRTDAATLPGPDAARPADAGPVRDAAALPGPDAAAVAGPDAAVTPGPDAAAVAGPDAAVTPGPDAAAVAGADAGPVVAYADYPVPGSIDKLGATDVRQALADFFATVPDGTSPTAQSRIVFPAAGIFRIDAALKINGRSFLAFEGNGATVGYKSNTGSNENYSVFYFQSSPGNSHITVHDFVLVGSSPTPGVYIPGQEGQHGVLVDGGDDFEIHGCTVRAMFGDGFEVNSGASYVRLHDNDVQNTGRNGVSVITGNHVEIDHNQLMNNGYMPFDVEPNNATGQDSSFINFHHNTTGTWTNLWFTAWGGGSDVHDVVLDNNTSVGAGLDIYLEIVNSPRRRSFTITNNTSNVSRSGPVMRFAHVDGLVIQHNTQPLSSGSLVQVSDCPGAVTSPNP